MFCKYCGTRLDDVQNFCGNCGRAVDRNIKFADPTAKLFDEVKSNEPEEAKIIEEKVEEAVAEERHEILEEAPEALEEAPEAEATEEVSVLVALEESAPEADVEDEPVEKTGLKIGLLVWSIINMAFGMFAFGIPSLIMNIRAANRPVNKTKKSISYIKILNFAGSLVIALAVFYGAYMTLKYGMKN